MKSTFKTCLGMTAIALATLTTSAFAYNCPTLSAKDVRSIIETGFIGTNQGYSLADEAGETRAQVITNEPTANPFDTFYSMMGQRDIDNHSYTILVGNILGGSTFEAKDRAKQILIGDEKVFNGKYDETNKVCMYKEIQASESIPNYPFKSQFESVYLAAGVGCVGDSCSQPKLMMKKHR